jgi:hypothetical protein
VGWLRDKLFRGPWRGAAVMCVCDSCSADLERATGYFLTTSEVVQSEAYWTRRFRSIVAMSSELSELVGDSIEFDTSMFEQDLLIVTGDRTPWCICEECSELFVFDRDLARKHAVENTRPPGTGPVARSLAVGYAAAAWQRVHRSWPLGSATPAIVDQCDLCRKAMRSFESSAILPLAVVPDYRACGLLERDIEPLPRSDIGGWLCCLSCHARLGARAHRLGYSLSARDEPSDHGPL